MQKISQGSNSRFIFIGAPGVGKGTYARRISPQFKIPHISSGDLFRAEAARGSNLGLVAKPYMDRGDLVPNLIANSAVESRLLQEDAETGFILDGYPRSLEQVRFLEQICQIDTVLFLHFPEHILIKKNMGRRVCKSCAAIYNVVDIDEDGIVMPAMPPVQAGICDKCGAEVMQRKDDTEEVLRKRLRIYHQETDPVIDYYGKKGLIKNFSAIACPEETVPKIIELLKSN